jgi:aminomethyltransferase
MLKKSAFFDFLNRRDDVDFDHFLAESVEDEQYINWNEFVLPMDYGDAEAEYTAIRNCCALFDVSPIRKIRVHGPDAGAFFDRLLTRPVSQIPAMRATYTVLCNDDGSLKDDAILYKFAADEYLIMPSDVDHSPYFESVRDRFGIDDVTFTECTDAWSGLAIQGPLSATVISGMGFAGIEKLRPFEVQDYEFDGGILYVSRMGFTADLGYECWFEPALIDGLIRRIQSVRSSMNINLPGYGLDALQACRLEGGFIVAGWDCATELEPNPGFERSPFDLGLGWLVNLEASDFIGRDALLEQKNGGHPFTLRSFELNLEIAPEDGAVLYAGAGDNNASVGAVNCSSWSWGMKKTIGNASVKSDCADLEEAWLSLNGEHYPVRLSRGPLINLERRNQVPALL